MNQVLLIEDEISVRLATAQSLKLADIEVTAVATAEEALPWLRSDFVGVVVSDVRLPGRSGLDVLALAMQADSLSSADGLMLPATPTVLPARSTRRPASAVVVVLPLVPVMASTLGA